MKPRQASPLKQPPSQVRTLAAGLCCDLREWGLTKSIPCGLVDIFCCMHILHECGGWILTAPCS